MDLNTILTSIWEQIEPVLQPHYLNIAVTFFVTQNLKQLVPEKVRPGIAIITGILVAIAASVITKNYSEILLNGLIYGAGAIVAYKVLPDKWISRIPSVGNTGNGAPK